MKSSLTLYALAVMGVGALVLRAQDTPAAPPTSPPPPGPSPVSPTGGTTPPLGSGGTSSAVNGSADFLGRFGLGTIYRFYSEAIDAPPLSEAFDFLIAVPPSSADALAQLQAQYFQWGEAVHTENRGNVALWYALETAQGHVIYYRDFGLTNGVSLGIAQVILDDTSEDLGYTRAN